MFEGIPSVLPIMEASDARENFSYLLAAALSTLLMIDITFAELSYYAYGDTLTEPLVMQMIAEDHPAIITAKALFVIMLVFSYPLTIYVTNQVLEYNIFRKMEYGPLRYWLKNLSRTTVCAAATLIAVTFYKSLHVINGLIGVILGGTVVMIVPSLIHNRLSARTPCQRFLNYALVTYAIVAATVVTIIIVYKAVSEAEAKPDNHEGHHEG